MRREAARGFTLIELLAVVAIIAILASIALARLFSALEHARVSKAIAEISQIHRTIEMFRATTGEIPLQMSDMVPQYYTEAPVDPWGTPYVYNNFTQITPGQKRKDGPLVPINREFDIFSMGPDKQSTPNIRSTPGANDVIFANDGGFIDVASKY